ncbi:hypothetical protein N8H22_15685 [Stutzerimonas stutzeri]|uniref:DUF6864 domain-containing function n=1 Tax=Stutzerimonas sp. S1 TaxID=3030652 RepID=UPI002223F423|nr:hypothetical protein [Stutzerimonas sp. S1]MCW3150047.1 hypothetical protein [Stutzerimonas sp. S1]
MKSKCTLDGMQHIDTINLLIPKNSESSVTINIPESITTASAVDLKIKIRFMDDGKEPGVNFTPQDSWSLMTLHNWENSLGTSLTEFFELATIDNNKHIMMMMMNHRIGAINSLTIQLWSKVDD